MDNLVHALNILQNEKKCAMGYLLPTIATMKIKLVSFLNDTKIKHCIPLVKNLLDSLSAR